MKKILLPVQLFSFDGKISEGLISSLKLLVQNGFELYISESIGHILEKILLSEGIILKNKEKQLNDFIIIKVRENKKNIVLIFNNKKYKTFYELTCSLLNLIRVANHSRKTKETDIRIKINLDGRGNSNIKSGIGFFNHMLEQISRHANLDLFINAKGDLEIDEHHTVEDIGITLGEAIRFALGSKKGIQRYGFFIPMDEAAAICSIDLGGRAYLNFNCEFNREKVGDFPTELVKEFFRGLTQGMQANIFIKATGENEHHKIESIFKVFAKALNEACRMDERNKGIIPTTKGII
jgi:imidazoleglycerol-phosphate dehydratase/histidinol-phosphatase